MMQASSRRRRTVWAITLTRGVPLWQLLVWVSACRCHHEFSEAMIGPSHVQR